MPRAMLLAFVLGPAGALFGALGLGVAAAGAGAAPGSVVLQSVSCDDWREVPANFVPAVPLDDTGGHYVDWGPIDASVVHPLDRNALPDGCRMVDGVSFRVSGTPYGNGLAFGTDGGSPGPYPADATSVLEGSTGANGSGTLRADIAQLSAPQQQAIYNGVGLWVEALDVPGDFANLRCHTDRYHADNLEVIRAAADDRQVTCVLYVVNRAVLPSPPPLVPTVPVTPAVPVTPVQPAPVVAPPAPAPTPVVVQPTLDPGPVTPAVEVPAANPVADGVLETPPVPAPTEATPTGGTGGRTGLPTAPEASADPLALALRGELTVSLTVRTVGQGPLPSAWAASAVVVTYDCADQRRQLRIDGGPGEAVSPVLALPAGAMCRLTVDGPPPADGLRAVVRVDDRGVVEGEPVPVGLSSGEARRMVRVQVDLPGRGVPPAADDDMVVAGPQDVVVPVRLEVASGPISLPRSRLSGTVAVGLGAVFLTGLGLSVVAARRPL